MKFNKRLRRVCSVGKMRLKKHSPEIMVTIGAVGTVGAAIMACYATTKLPDTLDKCRRNASVANSRCDFDCCPFG